MSEVQRIGLDAITPGMRLGEMVYGPLQREDFKAYADALVQ